MTVAGVLPVALYGSEHEVWRPGEIARARSIAVRGFGLAAPGVPTDLAAWREYVVGHPKRWHLVVRSVDLHELPYVNGKLNNYIR